MSYEKDLRRQVGETPLFVPWVWAVIQDEEDRLLLAVQDFSLRLPGWPLELGEQFQETLVRGLQTELGLSDAEYRVEKQFAPKTRPRVKTPQGEVQTLDIGYLVTITGKLPRNVSADFSWIAREKVSQQQVSWNFPLPFLQQYLQEQRKR